MSEVALLTPDAVQRLLAELPALPTAEKRALLEELDLLDRRKKLQACRDDFMAFCKHLYANWKEGPHHRYMKPLLHAVCHADEDRLTVSMPPRFGKALALDTEIPTPDKGFVRMGDLRVGDKVFAVDGTVTEVQAVSPVWRNRPVYKVTTNDGFSVVADAAHEWTVVKYRKRPKWAAVDTAYVHRKTAATKESRALRIPLQAAAQYPEAALIVHPYVLGVWLGDGRSDSSALCTADDYIFDKVNSIEGPDDVSLHARLRRLGVLNAKHIPEAYLTASQAQRLQLLQGLMDTDGTVAAKGRSTFYNKNERLARQVQELVQSLGTKASLKSGPAMLNGKQFGTCWKVHFFMKDSATLPRKAQRCRASTRTTQRYIRAEPAGTADTVCIQIAHPSHLFLCTRGYIPTHNSETIAYMFVAWYLGHHPNHHIMMVTHTAALSADFGRKIRNLLDDPRYTEIFPQTAVSKDKSAADNWATTMGGKYLAVGIGGNVAGHGAHLLIADDLVSEQAVLANPDAAFENAWTYMQVGPLQRLMPGGRIVMIGTRWGRRDPIGRALAWAQQNEGAPQWREVRFPAIMPSGKSLWPEQWPVEQLLAKKAGMAARFWSAQYMQEPTSEEGALLKREWWKLWETDRPPSCEFILQVWDTAHDTKSHNDYSACITMGVWYNEQTNRSELILLNAIKDRWEFPQLKAKALEHYKEWEPDCLLIEKKAAGAPLIQELRQMDMFVEEYSPSRGTATVSNDKRARVNAVSPILEEGVVWAPDTRWAQEVIEECAEFPNGEHDDYVDCVAMALARYRAGGFVSLRSDRKDDPYAVAPRRAAYY